MARPSKIDATHFHATGPHAASKPARGGAHKAPAVPGETPQQKVKRLREAANRAKHAQVSGFDKAIVRGRVWADRAHRFTTLSLIGITGIAGVVTVYALGDMMIHNRRKRAEYFAEQKALHTSRLWDAQKAVKSGTASEEQVALLATEKQLDAEAEARKNKKGMFARGKEWLVGGLKTEDGVESPAEKIERAFESEANEAKSSVLKAVGEKREEAEAKAKGFLEVEKERQRNGGMLDRLGTEETQEQPKSGGWTSFLTRR